MDDNARIIGDDYGFVQGISGYQTSSCTSPSARKAENKDNLGLSCPIEIG
jgi:hypothetical protein